MEIFVELPFLFRAPIHVLILQSTSEPTGTSLTRTSYLKCAEDICAAVSPGRRYHMTCRTHPTLPISRLHVYFRSVQRMSHCIKDPDVDESTKISSVQQGFLVCTDWYNSFTTYTHIIALALSS
ncbi:hypothetical protein OG21DRAFT_1168941 [Imleria badia]|nr:hypothetical protein OG21DRAFT_1168941 [Imleria badia]